ncbi:MAG TPA: YdcF family protein [Patescibacteria group bacterium]|jgi:uncharacterized SAM-binding protein YcdF (DUF218 family)|nr:YdcF family protein [Patescibacteria group bacterium]
MIKRILKIIVVLVVAFVIADASLVWGIAHSQPEIKHSDAVIVLGAAINTPALTNRTKEGLQIYQQGKADVMILSGGKIADADISEAEYMEKVIKKNTTEHVEYILEDQSHNTYDNIRNSKAKLTAAGYKTDSVIVVSDAFHLARAFLLAKRAGFKDVYWSAPNSDIYPRNDLAFYYAREFIAIINYLPKFIFG